jgi:hypothetical protein
MQSDAEPGIVHAYMTCGTIIICPSASQGEINSGEKIDGEILEVRL